LPRDLHEAELVDGSRDADVRPAVAVAEREVERRRRKEPARTTGLAAADHAGHGALGHAAKRQRTVLRIRAEERRKARAAEDAAERRPLDRRPAAEQAHVRERAASTHARVQLDRRGAAAKL